MVTAVSSPVRTCVAWVAALAVASSHAATIEPAVTGSGVSVPPGGADPNWEVVALPTLFTSASPPYAAFVFSGTGAGAVPANWLGGPSNDGAEGARWIGAQAVPEALFPGGPVDPGANPPQVNYNVIYRYTFFETAAGPADFDFWAAADNVVSFYLNGTVVADPMAPSIVDGTQIGGAEVGFGRLHSFSGSGSVVAGANHLYAVVTDRWNDDGTVGTWGYTGLLVSPVPEPVGLMLAASGAVAIGAVRSRQRAKRHPSRHRQAGR